MSTSAVDNRTGRSPAVADPALVSQLREAVAARIEASGEQATDAKDERARAGQFLSEELAAHSDRQVASGGLALSAPAARALGAAVWSALYGLGPLQQLLELPDVENIHIHGCDRVVLEHADGSISRGRTRWPSRTRRGWSCWPRWRRGWGRPRGSSPGRSRC